MCLSRSEANRVYFFWLLDLVCNWMLVPCTWCFNQLKILCKASQSKYYSRTFPNSILQLQIPWESRTNPHQQPQGHSSGVFDVHNGKAPSLRYGSLQGPGGLYISSLQRAYTQKVATLNAIRETLVMFTYRRYCRIHPDPWQPGLLLPISQISFFCTYSHWSYFRLVSYQQSAAEFIVHQSLPYSSIFFVVLFYSIPAEPPTWLRMPSHHQLVSNMVNSSTH